MMGECNGSQILVKGPYAPSVDTAIEGFLNDVTIKSNQYWNACMAGAMFWPNRDWIREPRIRAVGDVSGDELSVPVEVSVGFNVTARRTAGEGDGEHS